MGLQIGMHAGRPFPPPTSRPWVVAMRWHDLLFMHWPVDAAALRPHVPAGLEIETFDGRAWLGVVPFWMSGVRARLTPAVPGLSRFPELNVRTYVSAPDGEGRARPGVYFFSLDAANPVAVRTARRSFHLRYMDARMRTWRERTGEDEWVEYESVRTHRGEPAAEFRGRYRPVGIGSVAEPGTLVSFVTDRYCLYSSDRRGRVYRADIHHGPWILHDAAAQVRVNTMAEQLGIDLGAIERGEPGPARWPMLHYSARMDVVAWWPERVRPTR